jgi:hypothetical protein
VEEIDRLSYQQRQVAQLRVVQSEVSVTALKVPKGSEAKAKYHLGQLREMFARADDHAFLQMIWAVDALQDGRSDVVAGLLTYPNSLSDETIREQRL